MRVISLQMIRFVSKLYENHSIDVNHFLIERARFSQSGLREEKENNRETRVIFEVADEDRRDAGRWDYRLRLRLNGVGLEIRRLTSRFPSASLNRVINDIADWTAESLLQIPDEQLELCSVCMKMQHAITGVYKLEICPLLRVEYFVLRCIRTRVEQKEK